MSLTGQWQFLPYREWVITENCHWPVNDNFCWHRKLVITENCQWSVNDSLKQLSKNVIDRSITIFVCIRNGLSQKIVIDIGQNLKKNVINRSMTIFEAVPLGVGQSRESLTYHFGYGHTTYGQMSLTTVNDKNLWTKL